MAFCGFVSMARSVVIRVLVDYGMRLIISCAWKLVGFYDPKSLVGHACFQ